MPESTQKQPLVLFEGVPPAGWRVFKFEGSDEILLDETHWSDQGKPEKGYSVVGFGDGSFWL